MSSKIKEKAKKEYVLKDIKVEADLSKMLWRSIFYYNSHPEEYIKELKRAVKEFEEFLRDHRSQDMVRLSIEKQFEYVCSNCQEIWEIDKNENGIFCANCGAEIDES